jgi:hypothetical protein
MALLPFQEGAMQSIAPSLSSYGLLAFALAGSFFDNDLADGLARFGLHPFRGHLDQPPLGKFEKPAKREVHDDLMVLQSLASLDGTQVPQEAVVTVAHSS